MHQPHCTLAFAQPQQTLTLSLCLAAPQYGTGSMGMRQFLTAMAPVVSREPNVFLQAMYAVCSIDEASGRAMLVPKKKVSPANKRSCDPVMPPVAARARMRRKHSMLLSWMLYTGPAWTLHWLGETQLQSACPPCSMHATFASMQTLLTDFHS